MERSWNVGTKTPKLAQILLSPAHGLAYFHGGLVWCHWSSLLLALQEEISEIKVEGNLEAVLNSLDKIVQEGKDRTEPAW